MNHNNRTLVDYSFDRGRGDAQIYRNEEGVKEQKKTSMVVKKDAAKSKSLKSTNFSNLGLG